MIEINKELNLKSPFEHSEAQRLNACIKSVINNQSFGTIIVSSEGLGKTRGIRHALITSKLKEDIDWIYISANITDTELFKIMLRNKDKIIVFDDIGKAAKTQAGITILKQATETIDGITRKVSWNSPTYILKDVDTEFLFTGRLIMCLNSAPDKSDADIRALMSRILSCDFFPNNKTILEMMYSLLKEKAIENDLDEKEIIKIFDHIQFITTTNTHGISLRLLDKSIMWYKTDRHWKQRILEDIGFDSDTKTIIELNNRGLSGRQAVQEWEIITGKRKSQYYNRKEQLQRLHLL